MIARAENAHAPTGRKVSVQIETGRVARLVDGEAVVVFDQAFLNQSVSCRAAWCTERSDGHHDASILLMFDPSAIGVGDAHRQNSSVAVDVLRMKTRPQMTIAPWPRSHTRAMKEWLVGKCVFDAVGVDAWGNIKSSRAQRLDNRFITCVKFLDEILNYV